jgi:GTP-binding protein HflX
MRFKNLAARRQAEMQPILISAASGEGIERLVTEIERRLAAGRETFEVLLPVSDGAGLSWLHRHSEVITKRLCEGGSLLLKVRTDASNAKKLRARFGQAVASH